MTAIRNRDTATVRLFLDAGMTPFAVGENGIPALVAAVLARDTVSLRRLLASGADPDQLYFPPWSRGVGINALNRAHVFEDSVSARILREAGATQPRPPLR